MKRHFLCFATATNTGLRYSRPDIMGVRDIGGDHSGDVESIIIEVKRGNQPFATASGQTLGYRVYSDLVYLADLRSSQFSPEERQIASHLGIGLIQINGRTCREVLSSPTHTPITKLNRALLEKLALGTCQLCGCVFRIADSGKSFNRVARENLRRAIDLEKGLMFWNREVAERKRKLGLRNSDDGKTFERRFLCPDCVSHVLAEFKLQGDG